jgi:hypothetical protein
MGVQRKTRVGAGGSISKANREIAREAKKDAKLRRREARRGTAAKGQARSL